MSDRAEESDLRRRAAWLLLMLGVVAVLFVIVLSTVLDSGGNGSNGAGPNDTLTPAVTPSSRPASTSSSRADTSSAPSTAGGSNGPATRSCPTAATCTLQGDLGKAIDAVNALRAKNGQKSVPGAVSKAAQKCALSNGNNCNGGWAETQVPALDGAAAVDKIAKLGKLLDPQMKSIGIGWAYSPKQKQYFFAIIRNE